MMRAIEKEANIDARVVRMARNMVQPIIKDKNLSGEGDN
jgi:hypothetical protein